MRRRKIRRRGTDRNKRLSQINEFPGDDGTFFDDSEEPEMYSSGGPDVKEGTNAK